MKFLVTPKANRLNMSGCSSDCGARCAGNCVGKCGSLGHCFCPLK